MQTFSLSNRIIGVFKLENENAWTCLKVQVMSFSHICLGKCVNIFFWIAKNILSPDNKFFLHTVWAIGKLKKNSWKNVQVQLISFIFVNVEIIGNYKICKKNNSHLNKFSNPANKFLLPRCINSKKMQICKKISV